MNQTHDNSPITGLWRLGVLKRLPQGTIDDANQVFWLQTQHLFGDIRVPFVRDLPSPCTGFGDFSDQQLIDLARQKGFGGHTVYDGKTCHWHREIDFQPPTGEADHANASLAGDLLIETGFDGDFVEDWHRQTGQEVLLVSFCLVSDSSIERRSGVLVIAGDHFIEVLDRSDPLPQGISLPELVEADLAAGDRPRAINRLGACVSYGRLQGNNVQWEVSLSTFPWRERGSLFEGAKVTFDTGADKLTVQQGERTLCWRLVDRSATLVEVAAIFAGVPQNETV
jgi:hypothetical protein